MKRKQLRAELALKGEYAPPSSSSPEHDASLGSGDQSVDLCGFPRDGPCDWQDLADLGEHSGSVAPPGVKMEDDEADGYRLDCDEGDGEGDEEDDCFPSLLSDIDRGEGRGLPEAYAHINEFGMLSASKGAAAAAAAAAAANISAHRDLPLGGWAGTGANAPGLANHEAAGHLVAMERQRVELERQRLAVERERLQLEKERLRLAELERERLQLERQRLQLERERLAMERERLQLERERLRVSLLGQPERADSSLAPPPQQGTPSSTSTSAHDGQTERERAREGEARPPASDLETERLRLEKERLQLEKERLQFFKFESGRLQIERERLQVEKERKQLHQDQGL